MNVAKAMACFSVWTLVLIIPGHADAGSPALNLRPPALPAWPYTMTEAEAANRTMLWVMNNVWQYQPSDIDYYSELYGLKNVLLNGYPIGAAYTVSRGAENVVSTFNLTSSTYSDAPWLFKPVRPFELRYQIRDKLQDLRGKGFSLGWNINGAVLNTSLRWPCNSERQGGQGHAWAWSRAYNASQGIDCITMPYFTREYDFFNQTNIQDLKEAIASVSPYVDYIVFDEMFYWSGLASGELNAKMCEAWDPTATNWHPDAQQAFMSRYGYNANQLEWLRTWNGTYDGSVCNRTVMPAWPERSAGNRQLYDDWVEFKGDVWAEWYRELTDYSHSVGLYTVLSVITPTGLDPTVHKADSLSRLVDYFDVFYTDEPFYGMRSKTTNGYYSVPEAGEIMRNNFNPGGNKKILGAIAVYEKMDSTSNTFGDPAKIAFNFFAQAYAVFDGMFIFQLGDPNNIVYQYGQPVGGYWGNGWDGKAFFPTLNASGAYCKLAAREIPRFGPLVMQSGDVAILDKKSSVPAYGSSGIETYPHAYSNLADLADLVSLLRTYTDISVVTEDADLGVYSNVILATDYFPENVSLAGKKVLGLGHPLWNSSAIFAGCCAVEFYYMSPTAEDYWGFKDRSRWPPPYNTSIPRIGTETWIGEIEGDINYMLPSGQSFLQTISRHPGEMSLNPGTVVNRLLLPPPGGYTGASAISRNSNQTIFDFVKYSSYFNLTWATEFIRSDLRLLGWYRHNDRYITDGVWRLHIGDWLDRQPLFFKGFNYHIKQFDPDGNMTEGVWAYKEANHDSEFGRYWEAQLRPFETILEVNSSATSHYEDSPDASAPSVYVQNGSVDYAMTALKTMPKQKFSATMTLRTNANTSVEVNYALVGCKLTKSCAIGIIDLETQNKIIPYQNDLSTFSFLGVINHHYRITVDRGVKIPRPPREPHTYQSNPLIAVWL